MSLLFFDGFEGMTGFPSATLGRRYSSVGTTNTPQTGTAALGGRYLFQAGTSERFLVGRTIAPVATVAAGARQIMSTGTISATTGSLIAFLDSGAVQHITITVKENGAIEARRGTVSGTVLGTSSAGVIDPAGNPYVEALATIDDSAGGVWVRVNSADVLRLGAYALTPAALDTQNGGTAEVADVRWYRPASVATANWGVDDVYICNTAGAAPYNDFLGDVRVLEILPTAAGASTQFTPLAGANYAAVDDPTSDDSDSTYVQSATATHRDLYTMGDPASDTSVVYAAKQISVARKSDAGDQDMEHVLTSGATTSVSALLALGDSYAEFATTHLTDPDTAAAWTIAALDAIQSGYQVPA